MAPPLIELSGITKSYGPVKSFKEWTFGWRRVKYSEWSATTAPVSPL